MGIAALLLGRRLDWCRHWVAALEPGRAAGTRTSDKIPLPLLAGLCRPVILFPPALLKALNEEECRGIWLHEMGHVRRRDDWTNLGQRLSQALFFFHPAVHWLNAGLDLDRELACDAWAVSRSGAPREYAGSLARLAELSAGCGRPAHALGMAENRKQIFRRIEMLINTEKNMRLGAVGNLAFAAVALVAGTFALLAWTGPALLIEQSAPAVAAPAPPAPPRAPKAAAGAGEEEIRKLSAEIRKLTAQIAQDVQSHIRPQVAGVAELEARLHESEREIGQSEARIRDTEKLVRELQAKLRLAEERIRAVARQLEMKHREQGLRVPPAAPAPPAAAPAPPAPPKL